MRTINHSLLATIQAQFSNIFIVISPPRCGSTVFARVLWNHPSISYYSHEPFEKNYYKEATVTDAFQQILNPLSLPEVGQETHHPTEQKSLIIKDIAFQSQKVFPLLASLTKLPIIFLIRDPRLSIYSKISARKKMGQNPIFPTTETGWEALLTQIRFCQENHLEHLIVDASDFRTYPQAIFKQVFERLGLPFSEEVLSWEPTPSLKLDNFGGKFNLYYKRVINSSGIQAVTEEIPTIEAFPTTGGMRKHVIDCLAIYHQLRKEKALLSVELV